ncbi:hypothetical protein HFP89_11955 [Wenzhouxiangella sp. XN79A]|uniref:hypothetical protein n=1 Tax=Wenzhouxiangella sp. XN79A TaxID=2724193 RepID=UPI00144A67FF|nr:hypothetical protein [Wenzhouxiangella sp. XN79A]NKI35877.1 hypothetical protein [Wenzhouxiangella sp. XN79A]
MKRVSSNLDARSEAALLESGYFAVIVMISASVATGQLPLLLIACAVSIGALFIFKRNFSLLLSSRKLFLIYLISLLFALLMATLALFRPDYRLEVMAFTYGLVMIFNWAYGHRAIVDALGLEKTD